MRPAHLLPAAMVVVGLTATSAVAQTTPPPERRTQTPARPAGPPRIDILPRASITITGGGHVTSGDFDQRIELPLFAESIEITGPVRVGRTPRFDVAAGFRLKGRLGVGVRVGFARGSGTQEATFSLPDPFQFAAHHRETAETGTKRTALDVQVQMLLLLMHRDRWQITATVGPTYTSLRQELGVNRFNYNYTFPFQTVTLEPVSAGTSKGDGIGVGAGVSITRRWTRRIAFEGHVRGTTGTVELNAGVTPVRVGVGGAQAGAGLRVVF